ncbi:VOC family protein [Aquincola sp. S2]|uniref:VOC family protein n=1 Tax=Pseudaquabacterium terrae TaxID=2732868 RepID=A0ABX2EVB9_9BURK|nr:VOC family protein [Aquabacterium terrae]NRF72430.1 VOC family protein [Aquabacterium terrae]
MKLRTVLTFDGKAEQAMKFYISFLPNARMVGVERYGMNEGGKLGHVKRAAFEAADGVRVVCMDMPGLSFTPASSMMLLCDDKPQFELMLSKLKEGGATYVAPEATDGSFAWVQDKFGVSWQLMLA